MFLSSILLVLLFSNPRGFSYCRHSIERWNNQSFCFGKDSLWRCCKYFANFLNLIFIFIGRILQLLPISIFASASLCSICHLKIWQFKCYSIQFHLLASIDEVIHNAYIYLYHVHLNSVLSALVQLYTILALKFLSIFSISSAFHIFKSHTASNPLGPLCFSSLSPCI